MKATILIYLLLAAFTAKAQPNVLREDDFLNIVLKFHPVARQAGNDVKIAAAKVVSARDGFDPQFKLQRSRKDFNGINYYDQQMYELVVPTWYGVELTAGTGKLDGQRINPEETPGSVGYLGVSIQPLSGLLMDERRAALLLAKNLRQLSEVERRIALNDLLKDALYSYWDWWEKYQSWQITADALSNARKRAEWVRTAQLLGDRPAIDTIEAQTQVQSFEIDLAQAQQYLLQARLRLSNYLWLENGAPAELPTEVLPETFTEVKSFALPELADVVQTHPELLQYGFKLRGLQVEKKLAFQSLLPQVAIKYNQTGYDLSKAVMAPWFDRFYRYGISVAIPLRLSKGRGDYRQAKLKIENMNLEQAKKQVKLYTRLQEYYVEWQQTELMVSQQSRLLDNVRAVQRGEETRFANGESSLFLLNARQLKTIESERKLAELRAKTRKAAVGVQWAAGLLGK